MIESLGVKNYRNLKDLQIKSLGRVNLITGKNNVGKSSLLETILIFVSGGDLTSLFAFLANKGEFYYNDNKQESPVDVNLKTFSALFHNRKISFFNDLDKIHIGVLEDLGSKFQISSNSILLRFCKYIDVIDGKTSFQVSTRKIIAEEAENSHIGIEIRDENFISLIPLSEQFSSQTFNYQQKKIISNIHFVHTQRFGSNIDAQLWDKIILTPKEDYVVKALQIIEPNLERLTFIANPTTSKFERIPVIKFKNKPEILPLQSMGDGLNRILTMILTLVNAENGYFMIDEFENGLHYSVQEKLWEVVFSLAFDLKIQVFATTHSRDCIEAFSEIINSKEEYQDCQYIRLDLLDDGKLKSTGYSPRELTLANKHKIETR